MIRGSTQAISRPNRSQKFPPPLMRLLRSNVGSKSKGRSRSRSLFFMRRKNAAGVEIAQEPSSPKVTCIGQVRVRRSIKSAAAAAGVSRSESRRKTSTPHTSDQHPCCHGFSPKFYKPRASGPSLLRKWVRVFGFGSCKGIDSATVGGSPARVVTNRNALEEGSSDSEESDVKIEALFQEDNNTFLGSSSSPPKNAFLLTRCRSAPYRSSSLASRFWGSPLQSSTETNDSKIESKQLAHTLQVILIKEKPISSSNCGNAEVEESRSQESEDFESSNSENCKEESNTNAHPLFLTRCKSEPARTGERLFQDAGFWRQRRFPERSVPQPSLMKS